MATIYEEITALQEQMADVQNNIATIQNQILDSDWHELPLASGILPYNDTGAAPEYRKIGNICYIRGAVKGVISTCTIGTLPPGFRPVKSVSIVQNTSMPSSTNAQFVRMLIGADGAIKIEAISNGAVFAADKWFPLFGSFIVD